MQLKKYYQNIISNLNTSQFLKFFLYVLIFFQPFNRFNSFREISFYGLLLFFILKLFKDKIVRIDFSDKTIVALSFLAGWSMLVSVLGPYPLDSLNAIRKNLLVQILIFLVVIIEFKDIQELKKLFQLVVASFAVVTVASIIEAVHLDSANFHQLNKTHKMFIGGYANNATFYLPFIAAYLISVNKTKWEKWTGIATLILGFVVIFIYNSRTALIAMPAGVFIIFLLSKKYKLFIGSFIIFILCISVIFSSKSDTLSKYRTLSESETYTKMQSRIFVWQGALHIIEKRPFLGYGYGWKKMAFVVEGSNLPDYWKQYYPDTYSYYVGNAHSGYGKVNPHNLILQIVFEIGLIGLGIFLWFWATIISKILKVVLVDHGSKTRTLMKCSIGGIVSYILINITNGFWQEAYGNMIFMFAGVVFVLSRQHEAENCKLVRG